jgi:hypothetical protein
MGHPMTAAERAKKKLSQNKSLDAILLEVQNQTPLTQEQKNFNDKYALGDHWHQPTGRTVKGSKPGNYRPISESRSSGKTDWTGVVDPKRNKMIKK